MLTIPHRKPSNLSGGGFTLIELVMVILIISILSVVGSFLMLYFVQNSVFIPSQLNAQMLASEAMDIMIEGDSSAKGLRFSRSITTVEDNRVIFRNQDRQVIRYRLDTGTNKLYRSISGGPEALLPYYLTSGINVIGINNALFTYYDAADTQTAIPLNVRRIGINLIASIGSGSYTSWEGQSRQSSSIAVKRFE